MQSHQSTLIERSHYRGGEHCQKESVDSQRWWTGTTCPPSHGKFLLGYGHVNLHVAILRVTIFWQWHSTLFAKRSAKSRTPREIAHTSSRARKNKECVHTLKIRVCLLTLYCQKSIPEYRYMSASASPFLSTPNLPPMLFAWGSLSFFNYIFFLVLELDLALFWTNNWTKYMIW